ncbi:MAG: type II toxin-antitoxin system RelE/ParE family toxin [Pseudomonadota bacterium]|nr:type II toxin-antitoxin system RelE/ParE family toxin [Pseudomonadota bacterium]
MQIRWQDDAINDLIQVRRFIAMDNPSAAARIADRIRSAVPELADQPGMGRPGRVPGTREKVLVDVPYIIAYRVEENSVVILRVLHTSRKWPGIIT